MTAPERARSPRSLPRLELDLVVAVAVGGSIGATARYGLAEAVSSEPSELPWATLLANVLGSFLIGVLMVALVAWSASPHRLLRPLVGVGVLGGFTTFSTYAVETRVLVDEGSVGLAWLYVVATPVLALVAVALGAALARRVGRGRTTSRREAT